ncbi:MAG: S1 RNA-binding domain-containing protein, partial [Burkholderiales bacterium]
HQDGLVHISALADRYVKDPHEVVKAGDIVKVKVLEIDLPRKRVALTMRLADSPEKSAKPTPAPLARAPLAKARTEPRAAGGAMAKALSEAMRKN